jgi:hypothetical protein
LNKRFAFGLLPGLILSAGIMISAPHFKPYMDRDSNLGFIYCTARYDVAIRDGIPYGGTKPQCPPNFSDSLLASYTIVVEREVFEGDPLACLTTRHNDWRFTFDSRRGYGFHNDPTYSLACSRITPQGTIG